MTTLLRRSKLLPAPVAAPDALPPRVAAVDFAEARHVAIVAPPGYGKTQTLARLAASSDRLVVWYALDASDADPATFYSYLVESVRERGAGFGLGVQALVATGQGGPEAWAQVWWAEWTRALLPAAWFLLDGVEALPAAVRAALGALIAAAPPEAAWALASRTALDDLAPAFAPAARPTAIGPDALRLGPAEVLALRGLDPAGAVDDAARGRAATIAEGVDGWPLGVALLVADDALPATAGPATGGAGLLAGALLAGREPDERAFMLEASLLDELDPLALGYVFDRDDAEDRVRALARRGLAAPAQAGVWRFPRLVGEGLRAQAEAALPAADVRAWRARAGDFYAYAQPDLAFAFYQAAGAHAQALAIAAHAFPALLAAGRVDTIRRWLERTPPAQLALDPTATLWRGRLAERAGDTVEARRFYADAAARAAALGDEAAGFAALVRQANLAANRGEAAAFDAALAAALPLMGGARPGDACDLLIAQALAAERHGAMGAAAAYNRDVLDVAIGDDLDVAYAHGTALLNLAGYAANRGDVFEAGAYLERLRALAPRWGMTALEHAAALYRGGIALQRGELAEARAALDALGPRWELELAWQDAAIAYELAANLAIERREWPQARERLAGLERLYERAGVPHGARAVADAYIRLAGRQGLAGEARGRFAKLGALLDDDFFDMQVELTYCQALVSLGADDEAAERLRGLVGRLPDTWGYPLARAALLLGLASGDDAALREGCVRVGDGGHLYLLAEDPGLWPRYAAALAAVPDGPALVAQAAAHFGLAVPTPAPHPDPAPDAAPLSPGERVAGFHFPDGAPRRAARGPIREDEVRASDVPPADPARPPLRGTLSPGERGEGPAGPLDAPTPAEPPASAPKRVAGSRRTAARQGFPPELQLSIRAFGRMEISRGATMLEAWPRRKSKVLLALLVLHPRGLHRVELARALYGDEPGAEANLRTIVSTLRGVLEKDLTDLLAGATYVAGTDEVYRLVDGTLAYSDVAEFSALFARWDQARAHDPAGAASAAADALALVRGPLCHEAFMDEAVGAERQAFQRDAQRLGRFLVAHHQDRGDEAGAGAAIQQLLHLDPISEDDVWLAIEHHARQGARDLARYAYWDYRKRLQKAVGEAPSAEFERRYRELDQRLAAR